MPTPRFATTRPARNTSTTSFGAITADDAAISSVTLTPTTRCHWTRARTTTLVACSAAHAPTAMAISRYGAVGIAATPPPPAEARRKGARPCRRAQSRPVLQREARPPRVKPRLKWQSVCRATGTGAPFDLPSPAGFLPRFKTCRAISGLALHTTLRFTIKRPGGGRTSAKADLLTSPNTSRLEAA